SHGGSVLVTFVHLRGWFCDCAWRRLRRPAALRMMGDEVHLIVIGPDFELVPGLHIALGEIASHPRADTAAVGAGCAHVALELPAGVRPETQRFASFAFVGATPRAIGKR